MNAIDSIEMLHVLRAEKARRAAERSLFEFTRQAWPIIEPSAKFVEGWHLHAICEHLEAVSAGEIENLLINIPPGCMKSIIVSVMWPAWEWIADPSLRYLSASYSEDLAIRDAMKTRDIITSRWYQNNWPSVTIRSDSNQKTKYELVGGGWRLSTSVGGRGTGEHPDRKIVDDPHNVKQAESDTERANALVWFDRTLGSRGVSRGAKTVVIMQRLHERDVSGHIMKREDYASDWNHICLPMEFEREGSRNKSTIGWNDPRTAVGSLLWPELFNAEAVRKLQVTLGEYGAAGQLQQRPSPAGGGILKVAHFQLWPHDKPLPQMEMIVQSYDTAFTESTANDPTANTVWGTFRLKKKRCVMLLDAFDDHLSYPQLRQRVLDNWSERYGRDDPARGITSRKANAILIEEKGSGISLLQDLRASNIPCRGYNPGRASKVTRAHLVAPILESDVVYILESSKEPGKFVTWARSFVDQCERFPNAEHDDYTDTFSQSMIYLRDTGWLDLDFVEDEPPEDIDYAAERKFRENPYAA